MRDDCAIVRYISNNYRTRTNSHVISNGDGFDYDWCVVRNNK